MNIYNKIKQDVHAIIKLSFAEQLAANPEALDRVDATAPREASHGDVATNAAMVLASFFNIKPRELADAIKVKLESCSGVEKVEIAGPGFINLTLSPSVWQEELLDIISSGRAYGKSDIGRSKKVNVEYVSVNPTGPMHVGHGRGAVFGDVLASLLQKAGYNVTREYYINDAGAQVDKLADSAYLRYREACGEKIAEIPEGLYPGEYLVAVGEALKAQHSSTLMDVGREEWLPLVRDFSIAAMMELIKSDLAGLGVKHDVFSSERAITKAGKVEEALKVLESKGLIYTGILEPPKGKAPEDWESRPQTLFKSTEFGDDVDRAIKKSDGSWTYFAPDIAYHWDKCQRGFDLLIDVFGADHGGYVKRIKSAVSALSDKKVAIDVKLTQMIKLLRGGEPAKMSKRAGNFVLLNDVVEEVGKGVFRFIMLTRKNDAPLDFDFEKVVEQSKDNPVFYVQYAHARACSVLRNVAAEMPEAAAMAAKPSTKLAQKLSHPQEIALIKLLCSWPRMVEQAAQALEPHRVAFFLQEVAAGFHAFWNAGNDDLGLRFIVKHDIELTAARVMLATAVTHVIASGLLVLGVDPLEEMR